MEIFRTTQKLQLPRTIIINFPDTLKKDDKLYIKISKFKTFFGENLTEINYIPVSGDLELIIDNKQYFLSNILLETSMNMGNIKIE